MICSSIDIGTNTVLLLVAEMNNGKIRPIVEKQRIPRLGKDVDRDQNLSEDSMSRVLDALLDYRYYLNENYPETVSGTIVTATSAVRDANNRDEFINRIKKETGWNIRLLSGSDEAKVTYKGALSVLENRSGRSNLVLDIGGGSTELAFGIGYKLKDAVSIDMGSVRFTERFFKTDPPDKPQIDQARLAIKQMLGNQLNPEGNFDLIGVAGTITSIAGIELKLNEYDVKKMNGSLIKKDVVEAYIEEFSNKQSQKIERDYPVFLNGRGEVILAGLLILDEVMRWCSKNLITTSTGGIRHGILITENAGHKKT